MDDNREVDGMGFAGLVSSKQEIQDQVYIDKLQAENAKLRSKNRMILATAMNIRFEGRKLANEEIAKLRTRLDAALKLLRELERCCASFGGYHYCPVCKEYLDPSAEQWPVGHKPDCRLAAVLEGE